LLRIIYIQVSFATSQSYIKVNGRLGFNYTGSFYYTYNGGVYSEITANRVLHSGNYSSILPYANKSNTVQFYRIQGHGNINGWALLGRYTIDADGNGGFGDLKLELNCHNSWDNVSILQDNMYILRFKAGGIVASTGFKGCAMAYDYGPSNTAIQKVRIIQRSATQYDFYLLSGWYNAGTILTVTGLGFEYFWNRFEYYCRPNS
jgi:hypothetical protein